MSANMSAPFPGVRAARADSAPASSAPADFPFTATPIPPLGAWDAALLLIYAAFFLAVFYTGTRGRMFWGDEIMGWMVIRAGSWHRLFTLWNAGIDSSGLFFYVFGRPWLAVFGATETMLRLFSACGLIGAFAVTWITARRFFRPAVLAVALPLPFVLNPVVMWQLVNGRTYGLMMLACALAGYALVVTEPDATEPDATEPDASKPDAKGATDAAPSGFRRKGLLLTFAAFTLLTGSHILGCVYWFCFFSGLVARDLLLRRVRLPLYLAAIAGLFVLPLSYRNIASTSAAGKPSFFTPRPHVADIAKGLFDYSKPLAEWMIVCLLLFAAAWLYTRRTTRRTGPRTTPQITPRTAPRQPLLLPGRTSLYVLIGVFVWLTLVDFAISRVTTSIFWDRYLMPLCLGHGLLLAELLSRTAGAFRLNLRPAAWPARFALLLAPVFIAGTWYYYVHYRLLTTVYPRADNTAAILAHLPVGPPVVVTDIEEFVELTHSHDGDRRWYTPIDWPLALDPSLHGGVSGLHSMEYWKAQGFFAQQILPTGELLAQLPSFTVFSLDTDTLWFDRRIATDPHYTVTELPMVDLHNLRFRVWRVQAKA